MKNFKEKTEELKSELIADIINKLDEMGITQTEWREDIGLEIYDCDELDDEWRYTFLRAEVVSKDGVIGTLEEYDDHKDDISMNFESLTVEELVKVNSYMNTL